jgi:hypothetical protein
VRSERISSTVTAAMSVLLHRSRRTALSGQLMVSSRNWQKYGSGPKTYAAFSARRPSHGVRTAAAEPRTVRWIRGPQPIRRRRAAARRWPSGPQHPSRPTPAGRRRRPIPDSQALRQPASGSAVGGGRSCWTKTLCTVPSRRRRTLLRAGPAGWRKLVSWPMYPFGCRSDRTAGGRGTFPGRR